VICSFVQASEHSRHFRMANEGRRGGRGGRGGQGGGRRGGGGGGGGGGQMVSAFGAMQGLASALWLKLRVLGLCSTAVT
jgi:hypothetical protein